MENIGTKLELLFLKAGQTHYYQYIITLLFTLEFCCIHFLNYCLPYFEGVPKVYINDSKKRENIYLEFCNNSNYTIINEKKKTSIAIEFGIYCNKTKIYFLGLCYHVGKIIGSCISYLLIDGIGRKMTFIIIIPISIVLMGLFKFMKASNSKNWIYGIYVDLFLSGISNYIIVVDILIYICEIVQQTKIPYFVMIIATGSAISGLVCSFIFHYDNGLDWRDILLIFGGIHLVVYLFFIFLLIGSPMFALSEEHFEDFSIYLRKIASRNGKNLTQEDFAFLAPYMPKETRKNMFEQRQRTISQGTLTQTSSSDTSKTPNISSINNNTNYDNINENNNNNYNNNINNKTAANLKDKNKDNEKDVTYVSYNNMIFSNNKLIYSSPNYRKRDSIFVKNPAMKDIYLLSLGEDADVPVKSLFGEAKMSDFTPLDLLRFQSQIKNFLTLSFIWIVTVIIRTGIDLRKKYITNYSGKLQFPIINFGLDICLPFILLVIYYNYQYSIQRI